MLEDLWQDVRYGARVLIKHPGFTVVAVLTLALGIGANTAIFSFVNTVLLRPLPFKDPDRLVYVFRTQPPIMAGPISRPDYFEWEAQNGVFQGVASFQRTTFNVTGGEEAERVSGARVTQGFFPLFGVAPRRGRFLESSGDWAGGGRVAVISEGLWQRRFGGDPGVTERIVTLDGDTYSIVGVAPSTFQFPARVEVWTPALLAEAKTNRGSNYLNVIARLRDGVNLAQAQAQMNQIASAEAAQYPDHDMNLTVTIMPILEAQVRNIRSVLLILLGAVAVVLLIACANVANLLLARATARQREIAIRAALGAGRMRIVRQLLAESVLLSLLGGAFGALLAVWSVHLLAALAPATLPRVTEIGLDRWVLGFTLLLSVLTGLLFGLAPALQVSRPDLNESLKEGARGSASGGPQRAAVRRVLVITEIALSFVLLVSAALLIKSISRLTDVNPGFDPRPLLTANVSLPRTPGANEGSAEDVRKANYFLTAVQQRIGSLPGVGAVGVINDLPVSGSGSVNGDFNIEGRPKFKSGEAPVAEFRWITPDYFRAIGIPLLRGRVFNDQDGPISPVNILVNEALARQFFPDQDCIGQRLEVLDDRPHEIIGVVGNARQWGLDRPPDPEIYFSYSQMVDGGETTLVVRTTGDPAALAEAVRRAAREVNRDAPVYKITPMTQVMADSTAQRRFNTILMTAFAGVALVLASVGLYGVISYSVAQRSHEIGIRMALGAQTGDVLRMMLWQGARLALAGVMVGLAASLLFTRLLSGLLYGVSATDAVTFTGTAVALTGVALLACYIPARRATKVEPVVALRSE